MDAGCNHKGHNAECVASRWPDLQARDLSASSMAVEDLEQYDAVIIVADHCSYDYAWIVKNSQLVIDTRNATQGIRSSKIVRC